MRRILLTVLGSTAVVGLSGCLKHTRLLERPQPPTIVMSSGAQQLIQSIDERYDAIHSMNAKVQIRASVGGESKGKVTDYTSLGGYILLRQPDMLRVLAMLPVVETLAFDMASDGKNFKLLIPPKSEAIEGSAQVTTPSPNALMNLRPAVFFDSMLIRKIGTDELVYVTSNSRVERDPTTKHLVQEAGYDLGILRRAGDSQQLVPVRVIHISRTDLMPYQQDEYNDEGILVTKTVYSNYQIFDKISYPSRIVISRPVDGYQIDLTIQKLTFNRTLKDDQFDLKIPAGTKIRHLP